MHGCQLCLGFRAMPMLAAVLPACLPTCLALVLAVGLDSWAVCCVHGGATINVIVSGAAVCAAQDHNNVGQFIGQ